MSAPPFTRSAIKAARAIPPRPPSAPQPPRFDRNQRRHGAPDPAAGLDENERALFNHLREWRSKQAHEEGVPAYLLLKNKQLVAIVRKRPESLNALGHIDGIGPGKIGLDLHQLRQHGFSNSATSQRRRSSVIARVA